MKKLDLSNKNLRKLEKIELEETHKVDRSIETILLDNNNISKLENLEIFLLLKNVIYLKY